MLNGRTSLVILAIFLSIFVVPIQAYAAGDVVSGPVSLTVLGGGHNDTWFTGIEGRFDSLNPVLNVHVFGVYDALDAGKGIGKIDNQRYGAGIAVSHTYARKANAFAGTSVIVELDKPFAHAYIGGKFKLSDKMLVTASYGFGFGGERTFEKRDYEIRYEANDWLKFGAVFVPTDKMKANLYAYVESPLEKNIVGLEGELSYYLQESIAVGVRGMADISSKAYLDKNWRAALFVTYAFGGKKGKLIDVALDKNQPTLFPRVTVFRDNVKKSDEYCDECNGDNGYYPE